LCAATGGGPLISWERAWQSTKNSCRVEFEKILQAFREMKISCNYMEYTEIYKKIPEQLLRRKKLRQSSKRIKFRVFKCP
jgi:hypothetical protein